MLMLKINGRSKRSWDMYWIQNELWLIVHSVLQGTTPKSFLASIRTSMSKMVISTHSVWSIMQRSEEHTSELQSRENLVCRLLLEKKNVLIVLSIHLV